MFLSLSVCLLLCLSLPLPLCSVSASFTVRCSWLCSANISVLPLVSLSCAVQSSSASTAITFHGKSYCKSLCSSYAPWTVYPECESWKKCGGWAAVPRECYLTGNIWVPTCKASSESSFHFMLIASPLQRNKANYCLFHSQYVNCNVTSLAWPMAEAEWLSHQQMLPHAKPMSFNMWEASINPLQYEENSVWK